MKKATRTPKPRRRQAAPAVAAGTNGIVDLYHQNSIDCARARAAGLVALIHKATQGAHFVDAEYAPRRPRAQRAGLLWGAYHFGTADDVPAQVEAFLAHAAPGDADLVALDFEPNPHGPTMTLPQAREFVELLHARLGRYPVLYGGSLLRESLGAAHDPLLARCPLWYARYAGTPAGIPPTWSTYTLWQYTDGNAGPPPHQVDGIGRCDRNRFQGSDDALRAAWPFHG